jgi:hypothetical protein
MTDRKDARTKLLVALESGAKYETMGHTVMCQKAFPKPDNFDGSRKAYAESATQLAILAWRNGSLDAAKALHEAVLPDWHWNISKDGVAPIVIASRLRPIPTVGRSITPARAWLIAILKALIACENTNANDKGE